MTNYITYDPTSGNILFNYTVSGTPQDEANVLALANVLKTDGPVDATANVVDLTTKTVTAGTPTGLVQTSTGKIAITKGGVPAGATAITSLAQLTQIKAGTVTTAGSTQTAAS